MQQIREFPIALPEIVWGALDWFLSYEIWILILTTLCIFFWRKWVFFQNVLLKMFTFVRHYMNFILSKIFVNIKTVLKNYCTQCLYWLNFFFWVYITCTLKRSKTLPSLLSVWNYLQRYFTWVPIRLKTVCVFLILTHTWYLPVWNYNA